MNNLSDDWLVSSSDDDSIPLEAPANDSQTTRVEPSNVDMSVETVEATESVNLSTSSGRLEAISKLETIFDKLENSLLHETELILSFPARATAGRGNPSSTRTYGTRRNISFPGRTPREAWRFTTLLKVLEIIYESLINNVTASKREIFYRDPALFVRQLVVDRLVDDIACAFRVPRASLNVAAAAKGLIAGQFVVTRFDGSIFDASVGAESSSGILIPQFGEGDVMEVLNSKWVLVVEKEAVFRALLSSRLGELLLQHGIIITGKGYPDIATRALLKRLSCPLPHDKSRVLPILGLVDYDPDGITILSTYKNGSYSLRHENRLLTVPSLEWIGLRIEDVMSASTGALLNSLLPLSARDRRKASKMLDWSELEETALDGKARRREIQVMLMLNLKAEIELLDLRTGGVGEWLLEKLHDM